MTKAVSEKKKNKEEGIKIHRLLFCNLSPNFFECLQLCEGVLLLAGDLGCGHSVGFFLSLNCLMMRSLPHKSDLDGNCYLWPLVAIASAVHFLLLNCSTKWAAAIATAHSLLRQQQMKRRRLLSSYLHPKGRVTERSVSVQCRTVLADWLSTDLTLKSFGEGGGKKERQNLFTTYSRW